MYKLRRSVCWSRSFDRSFKNASSWFLYSICFFDYFTEFCCGSENFYCKPSRKWSFRGWFGSFVCYSVCSYCFIRISCRNCCDWRIYNWGNKCCCCCNWGKSRCFGNCFSRCCNRSGCCCYCRFFIYCRCYPSFSWRCCWIKSCWCIWFSCFNNCYWSCWGCANCLRSC